MNQVLARQRNRFVILLSAIAILIGINVFASPPIPAPICRIEGTIKSTDVVPSPSSGYNLNVEISSVKYMSGESKFKTCEAIFPVGNKSQIYLPAANSYDDFQFKERVFEKKIEGVVSTSWGSKFDSYNLKEATAQGYDQNLYFGMKRPLVEKLQKDLSSDSSVYREKNVTGYFGSLTLKAVKRFQAKYGIPQTGYVGPLTRAKLNTLYGGLISNNQNCKVPLPYDDKTITSIDCVVGTYTPEQVIALAETLNGKAIEIDGLFSLQPVLVEEMPGGPVSMPTGGSAFHSTDGNIYMNRGADTVKIGSKVKIRGTFIYKPEQKSKGQYARTYYLLIPIYCSDCLSK